MAARTTKRVGTVRVGGTPMLVLAVLKHAYRVRPVGAKGPVTEVWAWKVDQCCVCGKRPASAFSCGACDSPRCVLARQREVG